MVSVILRIFCLYALLILAQPLSSQWSVSGHVMDASSGEGLSYVNIIIDNSSLGTTSDHRGNFRIDGLTRDQYGITFSMIGFQTYHLENISAESGPLFIRLQPEIYLSDEIVVSASRKTQSLSLAPASAAIVHSTSLIGSGVKSFEDAFHGVNGIQVTRSSGSNVQSLSIRGASEVAGGGNGNRVLLLLDGRPAISPESGGVLWNLIPLGAVERIEVIKGAYSSLFGSGAMGGIMNVITRSGDTVPKTHVSTHYGFYDHSTEFADFSTYHDFYGIDVTHSARKGKWSHVFNVAHKSNDGHREQTHFRTYNAFGKLRFDFSPNRSLQVSAMYNDIFNDTPGTWLSFTQPYNVAEYKKDDTQHRREWNADLHYVAFAHADIKYSTRFYYYSSMSEYIFNADPDNDSTNINIGKQFVDEESVHVNRLGNATQIDFSLGEHNYLIGGIELQSDFVDGRPDTLLYGRHNAWNTGAYIQDQLTLGKWIITGGIRWDQYRITGTFSEANISPKIASVYQPSEIISMRVLLARAYRNPSIAERYIKFEQGGGLTFKPNPSLRSEKLDFSAEAGMKLNLSGKLKFDLAVYYNHYKDLISYRQLSSPGQALLFEVINLNKAIMQGFELSVDFQPAQWLTISSGYTYLDARDASDNRINDILPYRSKHAGYAALTATYKKLHFYFQTRGRSRIEEVFIYPGSKPDGYILLNSLLSYSFNPHISASAGINNIMDVQYEELERYRMEGRNYTLSVSFTF